MKIEIKWIEGARKRPVPVVYHCNIRFTHDLYCIYSAIIQFPQTVRTYGDITPTTELLPDRFYITEGGRTVAEAHKYV